MPDYRTAMEERLAYFRTRLQAAEALAEAAEDAFSGMDGGEDHSMCHTGLCSRGECSQCQRKDGLRLALAAYREASK